MKARRRFPLYPFLFALYPILFLYSKNVYLVEPADCIRSAVIVLTMTALLLLLAHLCLRDNVKTGIAVSLIVTSFLSYGNAKAILSVHLPVNGIVVALFWCLSGLIVLILVIRTKRELVGLARFLRAMSVLMIAMALFQVFMVKAGSCPRAERIWNRYLIRHTRGSSALRIPRGTVPPDIYLIIVDAYTRSDVLKAEFDHDNSSFVGFLKSNGFYVPDQNTSNYFYTRHTVPSMMNMDYLQNITKETGLLMQDTPGSYCAIRRPRVVELLRKAGYKIVVIPPEYGGLIPSHIDLVAEDGWWARTEFDDALLETTLAQALPWGLTSLASWRERMLSKLDFLTDVAPGLPGPKYVWAHIVVTHPPFCFNADGSSPGYHTMSSIEVNKREYDRCYGASVAFTNHRLKQVIKRILATSKVDPVIIIQADHGAISMFPTARAKVFSAYHLPGGHNQRLYPSITPVNMFRVVFDTCFGTHYGRLQDATYSIGSRTHVFKRNDPETYVFRWSDQ